MVAGPQQMPAASGAQRLEEAVESAREPRAGRRLPPPSRQGSQASPSDTGLEARPPRLSGTGPPGLPASPSTAGAGRPPCTGVRAPCLSSPAAFATSGTITPQASLGAIRPLDWAEMRHLLLAEWPDSSLCSPLALRLQPPGKHLPPCLGLGLRRAPWPACGSEQWLCVLQLLSGPGKPSGWAGSRAPSVCPAVSWLRRSRAQPRPPFTLTSVPGPLMTPRSTSTSTGSTGGKPAGDHPGAAATAEGP